MKKIYLTFITVLTAILMFSLQGYSQTSNNAVRDNSTFQVDFDALIYPNPVTDNNFYVKSDNVIKKVEVINVIGQIVKTVNNETNLPYNIFVQFNGCEPGMYMVRITSADNKKIIKKVLIK
jgi:hypothetical protein